MASSIDADFEEHVHTYRNLVRGVRLVVMALAIILVLMAVFLL